MSENNAKNVDKKNTLVKIWNVIENVVYYIILIPLIIVTLMIVFQEIKYPDKIPNVFGWKLFIIMDEYMDDSVKKGDLVFTKNVDTLSLNNGNVIAFRNGTNTVTIHKIIDIKEEQKQDEVTKEERIVRTFTMKTLENETQDTRVITDSKVEGILRKRIPKLGLIILLMQKPIVLAIIIGIILLIGLICLYIAKKLDLKDERIEQEKNAKVEKEKIEV